MPLSRSITILAPSRLRPDSRRSRGGACAAALAAAAFACAAAAIAASALPVSYADPCGHAPYGGNCMSYSPLPPPYSFSPTISATSSCSRRSGLIAPRKMLRSQGPASQSTARAARFISMRMRPSWRRLGGGGLPAAAAAVTGSAAAAAAAGAVTAPHLHMLRSSRRRLRAAVVPLLDTLRGLRRGCTTHVLLRFILHSALQPGLRRQLLMRLDVAAQRAAQVALLQEQHEAWAAQQPALLHGTGHMDLGGHLGGRGLGSHTQHRPRSGLWHPLAPTSAGPGGRPTSAPGGAMAGRISGSSGALLSPEPLSARWYRSVFAAELRACVRQLELGSTSCGDGVGAGPAPVAVSGAAPSSFSPASVTSSSSASSSAAAAAAAAAAGAAAAKKQPPAPFEGYTDDATAAVGAPPGAFDLRDLYRLIRVLEVAAEDLAVYD